ncbi:histidine phosphatase family protein [Thiospirillum jenense]|uniref:Histidine phosphatase family protein n=1 Tax=Thiospirillum jenense TaxID=1653858 RepID=A0A839HGP2_9GAMM|nr:histidine phosphatase family protein [Thiospirillum jenense]MBB1127150.1 histidine phosphatase family protein [Thiospirillum jenense]
MTDRFIDLLRHGAVTGDAVFRGRSDDPLSAVGLAQMSLKIKYLSKKTTPAWDHIFCSPAQRCAAFAHQLAIEKQLPIKVLPNSAERDFGAWEGQSANQLAPSDLAHFWLDPLNYTPPNAELLSAFQARIITVWHTLCVNTDWHHALFITHGGVIRIILGEIFRLQPAALLLFEVPPACVTRLRIPTENGSPSLIFHGCFSTVETMLI